MSVIVKLGMIRFKNRFGCFNVSFYLSHFDKEHLWYGCKYLIHFRTTKPKVRKSFLNKFKEFRWYRKEKEWQHTQCRGDEDLKVVLEKFKKYPKVFELYYKTWDKLKAALIAAQL